MGSHNNTWTGNIAVTDASGNPAIANLTFKIRPDEREAYSWYDNVTFNGKPGDPSIYSNLGGSKPTAKDGNLLGHDPKLTLADLEALLQNLLADGRFESTCDRHRSPRWGPRRIPSASPPASSASATPATTGSWARPLTTISSGRSASRGRQALRRQRPRSPERGWRQRPAGRRQRPGSGWPGGAKQQHLRLSPHLECQQWRRDGQLLARPGRQDRPEQDRRERESLRQSAFAFIGAKDFSGKAGEFPTMWTGSSPATSMATRRRTS